MGFYKVLDIPIHITLWSISFLKKFQYEKGFDIIINIFLFPPSIKVKKYFELEPLARGKRWILQPCSLDDMDALKDSFSRLINLLEEKDLEAGRMWDLARKSGSHKALNLSC